MDVTIRISDDVGSGNTAIDLNRLTGAISPNAQNDLVVSFTVPVGQASGSTLSFTGITIAENELLDGELQFVLFIEGFLLTQTSGSGIFGFTTVTVEDDDDGKTHRLSGNAHAQKACYPIREDRVRNFITHCLMVRVLF